MTLPQQSLRSCHAGALNQPAAENGLVVDTAARRDAPRFFNRFNIDRQRHAPQPSPGTDLCAQLRL
jgi:hypothetical protein